MTPRYYIFSPAGHYLAGTIVLIVGAAASIWRLVRKFASEGDVNAEVIACCGVMHLSFLALFYGDFASWTYYYYILIIGLVAVAARGRRAAIVITLVAMAALAGNKDWGGYIKHQWRDKTHDADTFWLWADTASREEWRQVRQIVGDKTAVFLNGSGGCLELFMPQFADSEDMFLLPGYPTHVEPAAGSSRLRGLRSSWSAERSTRGNSSMCGLNFAAL